MVGRVTSAAWSFGLARPVALAFIRRQHAEPGTRVAVLVGEEAVARCRQCAADGPLATMANRLAHETSPYLLQHAHNPVDWYPWGEEAFARARAEDKPILLSIGYSACHWCHVMERESFENDEIAALMNRHFVNVKVDREERPDVDQIYMEAVQAMTGHGGWPMTVFLTPDGHAVLRRHLLPAERSSRSARLPASAGGARRRVEPTAVARCCSRAASSQSRWQLVRTASRGATAPLTRRDLDVRLPGDLRPVRRGAWGGLAGAPKFPQPMIWEFVLRFGRARTTRTRAAWSTPRSYAWRAAGCTTSSAVASRATRWTPAGWCRTSRRCSTTTRQLASLYLHAWLAFGDQECRRICEETLDYVLREMTDPAGGFYSAQDADSEGHEGKFFVWTADEIRDVLGAEAAEEALAYWGVDRGPNFEGKNILYVAGEPDLPRIAEARRQLYEARERRVHPGRDDKVLASWNGLACRAFAEAGRALGPSGLRGGGRPQRGVRPERHAPGRPPLAHVEGGTGASCNGYLEDYALVAAALLDMYEATFERRWLDSARELADDMLRLFWDDGVEGFYDTGLDHERLIVRPAQPLRQRGARAASSSAVEMLLRLAAFTGDGSTRRGRCGRCGRSPTSWAAIRRASADSCAPSTSTSGPVSRSPWSAAGRGRSRAARRRGVRALSAEPGGDGHARGRRARPRPGCRCSRAGGHGRQADGLRLPQLRL